MKVLAINQWPLLVGSICCESLSHFNFWLSLSLSLSLSQSSV